VLRSIYVHLEISGSDYLAVEVVSVGGNLGLDDILEPAFSSSLIVDEDGTGGIGEAIVAAEF